MMPEHRADLQPRQVDVAGLGDEHRRQRQVDRRAVEVERVAGRQHQPDHALLAAQPFELEQQAGQHRLARRGAEHDQQLLADVAQQLPQLEAVHARQQPEHDDDEEDAGDVEGADQQPERADRLDAVAADGERHRAEGAERRQPHDDAEGGEQHVREAVDALEHRLAGRADAASGRIRTAPPAAAPAAPRLRRRRRRTTFGMMCMTKSVKPRGGTWFEYFAATEASRCFGSMCMPAPGCIRNTATRPVSSARIVSA